MIEIVGIIASVLGILAFFAVAPRDLVKSLKSWFIEPVSTVSKKKNELDIKGLFDLLNVEDIRPENVFLSAPIKRSRLAAEVREYQATTTQEIERLKKQEIVSKKKHSEQKGVTFDNNGSFALRRIDVSRPEDESGKRSNVYKLILEPTDYFNFVFPNLCLDKSYYNESTQENHTLRDMLGMDKRVLSISQLENFTNCQFKVGTGTLLVTKDGYLICSVRSKNQLVASKQNNKEMAVHLSAAEGMYRSLNNPLSSDVDASGTPSPFVTSARSLRDELNLNNEHFDEEKICCLGYFFDLKRAQPFFLFYLEVDLTVDEFFSVYSNTSTDIHENEAIFALPKKFSSIRNLFLSKTFKELDAIYPAMYEDFFASNMSAKVRIASNHAQAGFAIYSLKNLAPITSDMV
ncbi:hypothetical protein RJY08_001495 [Vibrio alginolyticus]|uniref:hypothetical protein n=1 Tax=Vibrio alginolyticus TaxID=663 RepID=UPI001B811C1B|nr:hypothetical protein [Vibrio alginolyticus]ELC9520043.1 hypothetical protein [Vibrio alginolyticus]MCG9766572.1 hypothetical protein [Vibrio alginolyticus]HBC3809930.1 hypothetical protein [Vibrio alginolyticus]